VRRALASILSGIAFGLALGLAPATAEGKPLDAAKADALVAEARQEGLDGFCKSPERPLSPHARSLCPIVRDVKGCEPLVAACDEDPLAPKPSSEPTRWDWGSFGTVLAAIANATVWILIAAALGLLAMFIVRAVQRGRRDTNAAEKPGGRPAQVIPVATADVLETMTDAELLLAQAEEHARRGELDRASALYLAASLRALDRRGAIRIARHRTNGEYVRGCKDSEAKPDLRAIVREVDRVEFGRERATPERVSEVASRARAIVARAAGAALSVVFTVGAIAFLGGCTPKLEPPVRARDPLGDDLLIAVLERSGAKVTHLGSSLATLPIPKEDDVAPLVLVDAARIPLEEETRAHLARWVEAGGRLVLAGDVHSWPESFHAKAKTTTSTGIQVMIAPDDDGDRDDFDDSNVSETYKTYPAKVAVAAALEREASFTLAATESHEVYAATWAMERGVVIGFAGDDLFTNAGIARRPNAAAVVAILGMYADGRKIEIARPEDGISPPENPISALARAGLGLGLAHAAVATLLLMLAFGTRQARPTLSPPKARRAWTEHIEAAGGLYARARLAPHALAAYVRFVDGRLREHMPRGMSDPAAFLALRANADPVWAADVWRRASATRSADRAEGDELATLRHLSALYAAAMKSE